MREEKPRKGVVEFLNKQGRKKEKGSTFALCFMILLVSIQMLRLATGSTVFFSYTLLYQNF